MLECYCHWAITSNDSGVAVHRVAVLHVLRCILMSGADAVFVVVVVPLIAVMPVVPVVPVVAVRRLPRAQWGLRPHCMHRQCRHHRRIWVSHCWLSYQFRYCLCPVAASPGNAFLGLRCTISIYQHVHDFAKFSRCGSAAICIHYVAPCR